MAGDNQLVVAEKESPLKVDSSNLPPKSKQFIISNLPVDSPQIPAIFSRHELKLGTLIGEGSFSQVFEVTALELDDYDNLEDKHIAIRRKQRKTMLQDQNQNTLGRCLGRCTRSRYAVKQVHKKLLRDPKAFQRAVNDLRTEIHLLSKCHHPNIVELRGVAATGGTDTVSESYFIVLDRLKETLDERIHQWNLLKFQKGPSYYKGSSNYKMITLKATYALQIASALKYLHERSVIYRDLKPSNIGILSSETKDSEERLQLFDFGLARDLPTKHPNHSFQKNNSELFHMSMVGTRRYMAPETLHKYYNTKADVYSFAMVFFEMLTQTRPFDGIHRDEHKEYVCLQGKRPKIYSYYGLPKVLENLIRLSWAQLLSQRLTMNEVCATLEAFLQGTISYDASLATVASICASDSTTEMSDSAKSSSSLSFETTGPLSCSMDVSENTHDGDDRQSSMSTSSSNNDAEDMNNNSAPVLEESIDAPAPKTISKVKCTHESHPSEEVVKTSSTNARKRVSICGRIFRVFQRNVLKRLQFFHNATTH